LRISNLLSEESYIAPIMEDEQASGEKKRHAFR